MKRWTVVVLGLSIACGGSKRPPVESVGNLAPTMGNDCPSGLLGPFASELFKACPPPQYFSDLPICLGSSCGRPCAMEQGGFGGVMGQESYQSRGTITYDARGFLASYVVDGAAVLACTSTSAGLASCISHAETRWTVERDPRGRISAVIENDERKPVRYDASGHVVAVGDRELTYDVHGWLLADRYGALEHDGAGHLVKVGTGAREVTYSYDGDRLIGMKGPGRDTVSLTYDASGRLIGIARGGLETAITTALTYECGR